MVAKKIPRVKDRKRRMALSILLTGSSGYIGKHLHNYWSQKGECEVVRVDRSAGFDLSGYDWTSRLPERNVDVVIHLAQSRRYREFPGGTQDMVRVNVGSTVELIEWARKHGAKRFIFASTGTVYSQRSEKLKETAECKPDSMYAATKLSAEYLIQPYSVFFEIVIARLFTVFGPAQPHMLVTDMIERVQTDREIMLAGGVGIYITPLFIEDCVKVLSCLAVVPMADAVTILNVSGDEVLSLGEIIAKIACRLQKKTIIKTTKEKPKYFCSDNSRLKKYYKHHFMPFTTGMELTLSAILNCPR